MSEQFGAMSLAAALPMEIERVQEVIREYESLPGGTGMIGATLMKQDVAKAHRAMMEGDLPGMIVIYKSLKEWEM